MAAVFALVDCNNFYVSCERVFNPAVRDRPAVVLSNNDGCIIARSDEVKALHIPMGTPVFKVADLLKKHNVATFSSNYTLYGDMSRRVMHTLQQFTPEIEVYSIDEAFLNLGNLHFLRQKPGGLTAYARKIQKTVRQWTGIPVSIGIGPTKTLAKLANERAKKEPATKGVLNYFSITDPAAFLEQIPVEDVWGVAGGIKKRLVPAGIRNAKALREANKTWIRDQLGVVGLRLVHELNGRSCLSLEQVTPKRKNILTSRSFRKRVTSSERIAEALAEYATIAGAKLREQGLAANVVQVFLRTNRFKEQHYHFTTLVPLAAPTDHTPTLIKAAKCGGEKLFRKGKKYKKAGVVLSELIPAQHQQMPLHTSVNREQWRKQRSLMKRVDRLNGSYGRKKLHFAATGIDQSWQMKAEEISKRYTTRWDELPEVKAGFSFDHPKKSACATCY